MKVLKALKIAGVCGLILAVLMALCIWFMLGGADFTTYPEEKASSWVCNDPYIEINYHKLESHLKWKDEIIPILIGMHSSVFDVYRVVPGQVGLRDEDILFRGYWHYEWQNMVVEICEDNIFDGAYTELVFVPQ